MERKPGWWFSPHMAAAPRAIFERIPLVYLLLDARGDWLRSKSIVGLNEMNLANRSEIKEWLRHFKMENRPCFAVNAHNTDNIKQIASRPNVYVWDTTGILTPTISDIDICSKLTLTGAISNRLVGAKELTQYFLSVLNSSKEYRNWEKLLTRGTDCLVVDSPGISSSGSNLEMKRIRRYPSDHTQDFIVQDVRRTLFKDISSHQISQDANDSMKLVEIQMIAPREAFQIPSDLNEESCFRVRGSCWTCIAWGGLDIIH